MTPAAWEANFKKAQILKHGEMKCEHGSFCNPMTMKADTTKEEKGSFYF